MNVNICKVSFINYIIQFIQQRIKENNAVVLNQVI